jgi:AI-2E family transporter
LGMAILVIVLVVFMLLKREDLRDRLIRLMGTNQLNVTTQVLDDAASRISRYLVTQSIINGIQGIVVTIGLTLIGLPNAVLWGLLAAILKFIPYLGPWIAAALPAAQSMAVFNDWRHMLLTILLFILLEAISGNLVEPWLYGTQTGVTPVALIVAAVFWTWLWGGVGLILSTPLTVCLVVMGKYVPQLEFLNILLGDEPVLNPETRLYQRLLAMDLEEASEIVAEECKAKPFGEVCDALFIPVLSLIEKERHRGMLDENRQHSILENFKELLEDHCARDMDPSRELIVSGLPKRATILCLPSHDEADAVTAILFARFLQLNGVQAESIPLASVNKIAAWVEKRKITLVCLCALPPFAVMHTSRLSRDLRFQVPSLDIVVGLWSAPGDQPEAKERLLSSGASSIIGTFSEGLLEVQRMKQRIHSDTFQQSIS